MRRGPAAARACIELGAAQYGTEHLYTQSYRQDLLRFQLELERYVEAERTIAALDRNYRASKEPQVRRLANLHGIYGADIATSRGNPERGEQLAREALAVFTGKNADDLVRMQLLATIGSALVGQKRWADARKALEAAIAIARAKGEYAAFVAEVEIKLARVEAAAGETTRAALRATRAREVLVASPMALRARKEADAVLGQVKSKRPTHRRRK